jgi:hypothetical protein
VDPEPVHPVIVDRAVSDLAQNIAAGHGTSRDSDEANIHPAPIRTYAYRGRIYCRDCERRMADRTHGPALVIYYRCPHDPANPRQDAATTAAAAMRARIRARFAGLHAEREQLEASQRALQETTPQSRRPHAAGRTAAAR